MIFVVSDMDNDQNILIFYNTKFKPECLAKLKKKN